MELRTGARREFLRARGIAVRHGKKFTAGCAAAITARRVPMRARADDGDAEFFTLQDFLPQDVRRK